MKSFDVRHIRRYLAAVLAPVGLGDFLEMEIYNVRHIQHHRAAVLAEVEGGEVIEVHRRGRPVRRSLVCSPSENPAYSRVSRSCVPEESRGASRSFTIHSLRFHRDGHLQAKRWGDPRTLSHPSAERAGLPSRHSLDRSLAVVEGPKPGGRRAGRLRLPGELRCLVALHIVYT